MTLRLKINLIVGTLTLLFVMGLLAQKFDDMRRSVNEEVVAAHKVASQMLNRAVWGYAAHSGTRTVDVHIAQVRGKLGTAGALIRTHRGVGYAIDA